MDFNLDEELIDVQGLARDIFDGRAATDRVREVEATATRVDDVLWGDLAKTGLLGLALPEEYGGAGLGLDAACVVLEEQGRHVAPVPLWSAVVAALAVARDGSPAQRDALLPGAADGSLRLTLALEEFDGAAPSAPTTTATRAADGWLLNGVKAVVPTPGGADHVLVSATTPDGAGLFLVANTDLAWEQAETTSLDLAGTLTLTDTPAEALGEPGGRALAAALRQAALALAAVQVGVADGAMRLAASYTSTREQFGRPLGSFQAVQHQLADCWIDVDAMRVTLWQALTDDADAGNGNGNGNEAGADRSALVAKWWCDQAGLDVVHRVQHVHGGIGVDVDYPVHRHFLWGKQISSTLGGSSAALADLGALLAVEEVTS
ncbi:acyl-CoA dehydrogenase family protein [Nocardioides sp. Root140]|uniref:acyl-CoA dehydrogenase family protein n=1 Tax=Nocardioides sp. Root140 TaxID=1736460 RepID=UPI0006F634F7|nr:acyl-CoA dehydrogenase family protein [Nocardioides sp. Root140]KQY50945.1 acyl-CoA dehydrogenase [Nocardioides sp. Root140]